MTQDKGEEVNRAKPWKAVVLSWGWFCFQGMFGNVWRHLWFSQVGVGSTGV